MKNEFRRFASATSVACGSPWAFLGAVLLVVVWALCGPLFDYSTAWQLVINTGTTIITFLMVFLIQSTQNRDSKNINIKLDELLRAMQGARTGLANLDTLSDGDVSKIEQELIRAGQREGVTKLVTPEAQDRTRALRASFNADASKPVEPSEPIATVAGVVGRTGQSE